MKLSRSFVRHGVRFSIEICADDRDGAEKAMARLVRLAQMDVNDPTIFDMSKRPPEAKKGGCGCQ